MLVERVEAVYWEGAVHCSHPIRELSLDGAWIETALGWVEGTLIRMSVLCPPLDGDDGKPASMAAIWCRVARQTPTGMGVEFLFFRSDERKEFQEFLESINVRPASNEGKTKKKMLQWAGIG